MLSFEEDASLRISFMATGLTLFGSLGLPGNPLERSTYPLPELVFGGSSSIGTVTIQLLRTADFESVATCSPHNLELVKSYGANAVFDFRAPGCTADIRKHIKKSLNLP